MPTYSVITFGCRVNQADSQAIEAGLRARGATAAAPETADLVVVNTCSVTASADQGARQAIRRVGRTNPEARVIVTGCYATRRPEDLQHLPNVMRILSNTDKDDLVDHVAADVGFSTASRYGDGEGACGAPMTPGLAGRTALTLRVQTGCNERCSYCIIPRTRGAQRSLALSRVTREIEFAVAAGYKEIVVTGVHLGSYGRDLGDGTSLTALVRRLGDWRGDVRFRISSLEPMDCPEEVVDVAAGSPRIAPHFHLPLQHGDDEMLRAMQRPYSTTQYRRLLDRIRMRLPHAALGSDIIVGFPGEGDTHFRRMRRLLEELPLTYLHVFPYSERPGTAASRLDNQVDGAVIRERGREIRAVGTELARRFRVSQTGTTHRALTVDDGWSGVTGHYFRVRLDRQHQRNQWVDVVV